MNEHVETLVAMHREFLAFLEKRLHDRALAEDILQDAFARVDKLEALRDRESAVAWFYRVLRNAIIDRARREQARGRALTSFASELELAHEPEGETRGAICQCVNRLKDGLKPEYREALEHVELQGQAVKDYAAEAGITANNAAQRVFRARSALRGQVAKACGTCAEHGCVDCTCGS